MNPEQHAIAKKLFLHAIELEPDQIKPYITTQINDPLVLKQVLELINTYQTNTQHTHDFVEDIAKNISKSPLLFPSERYTLIKKIGQGGMGDVYLAQRKIKDIKQKVAIKILQLRDNLSKNRFSQEASILSQLSHPNISQFIDADFLSDGRPYVVMEYAEGKSITEYCQSNQLDIKARLSLFKSLCKAVEHAHRNLIIHRDIKPENILVNEQGKLMLLDFGIAKIIQESDNQTKTQMHAMTPAYASPEQFMGKPVSVSSDVYSLGVLLYELLTDIRPNEPKDHSPVEFEKLLRATKPTKPSLKVQHLNWKSTLMGDLDKITLKALQFDVSQRYQTVAELSDDLNRYHINLPVLAQTPNIKYRINKFIKRNKILVLTGLFAIGFISIFMTIILQQNSAIKRQSNELVVQRDQAQREQKRAETLSDTFIQAFKMADLTKTKGKIISAKDILDKSANLIRIKHFDDIQLSSQLIIAIAEANRHMGEHKGSLDLIQSIENNIGSLSQTVQDQLRYEKAMILKADEKSDQALKILESIPHDSFIHSLIQLGIGQIYTEKYENINAEKLFHELFSTIKANDPKYFLICFNYGYLLFGMGKKKELNQVLESCNENFEKNKDIGSVYDRNEYESLLGLVYQRDGNLELALKHFQETLEFKLSIHGTDSILVAKNYGNLANTHLHLGDFEQAKINIIKTIEIYSKYYGENHARMAYPFLTLAGINEKLNASNNAIIYYLKAIDVFNQNGHEKHKNISFFYYELSQSYINVKQYEKAKQALIKCSDIFNSDLFLERYRYTAAQILLSNVYLELNQYDKAKSIFNTVYPYMLVNNIEEDWDENIWTLSIELSKKFEYTSSKKATVLK